MAITTADFPTLTQKLNQKFEEFASLQTASWIGKELFDVKDTDWQVYNHLTINSLGGASRIAEGQQLPALSSVEGDSASATQKRYGARVVITKDLRMFDRYDVMERLVKSATDTTFNKIDQSFADILLNGFTGTSYTDLWGDTQANTSPDGVVLFSASHTNNLNANTYRNLIRTSGSTANPALDRDPIVQARVDAFNYQDPNSVNKPINLDTLIVGGTNSDLAERIVYSGGVQNTPNVDINPLKGKITKVLIWPRLDRSGQGTDTKAYWFMSDSSNVKESLIAPFAQKPQMVAPAMVHDTLDWEYPLDLYYTLLIGHPAFIRGSTGAN